MYDSTSYPSSDVPSAEADGASTRPAVDERPEPWKKIESRFRLWSFRVYYDKTFANEIDPVLRFAKALIASSQPIRDRRLVIEWNRKRLERYRRSGKKRKSESHADTQAVST